jgi:hypothetical protein
VFDRGQEGGQIGRVDNPKDRLAGALLGGESEQGRDILADAGFAARSRPDGRSSAASGTSDDPTSALTVSGDPMVMNISLPG